MNAPSTLVAGQDERELQVRILSVGMDFSEFCGTRAQLEAEGVIPPDMEWPDGKKRLCWESGKFSCWLQRIRPEGLKGPMKLWVEGDWWCLRRNLVHQPSYYMREILRKNAEIDALVYQGSAQGWAERQTNFDRYWDTTKDARFRAFKGLIPGLVKTKRGRARQSDLMGFRPGGSGAHHALVLTGSMTAIQARAMARALMAAAEAVEAQGAQT